jgi:DNA-binding transcriptional ArsR family regulator
MTPEFVRLPVGWIAEKRLREFKWANGGPGSDQVAALMTLVVVAHCADQETGRARLTYDELTRRATLSRAKVSRGLTILEGLKLVTRRTDGRRSDVGLANYDRDLGWAKLPVRSMYAGGRIRAFDEFSLRRLVELDAMKLFFLFAQRRDRGSNLANISYDGIEDYTGIARQRIKSATSLLAALSMVYVEHTRSTQSDFAVANAYRLVGVESRAHMGTRGRAMIQA